jgi:hypothetical protein
MWPRCRADIREQFANRRNRGHWFIIGNREHIFFRN